MWLYVRIVSVVCVAGAVVRVRSGYEPDLTLTTAPAIQN
jgi:hypothetical protein